MAEPQITLHHAGSTIFLKCHKCGTQIASEDVPFPGKQEDETIPRQKLHVAQKSHLQTCNK